MQSFFRFRTLELTIGRTEEDDEEEEEDPKVLVFSETVEVCDELRMQDRARRAMASEHTEKKTEKERVRIPPLQ